MNFTAADLKFEEDRLYFEDQDGTLLGEVTFPARESGIVEINHVYVNEILRGQGVASHLMEAVYHHLKNQGKRVIATCPYAISWFAGHPEKRDILIG
jgi:hypothetical protein